MTLRRYRIRPSTPSSFVKFAARLASVRIGRSSSTPTSAQVPQAMYANCSPSAGTPTTADAVSCEPTWASTGAVARPASATTSGRIGPTISPGRLVGRRIARGSPSSSSRSVAQPRRSMSNSPVVEPFVSSAAITPVSQ